MDKKSNSKQISISFDDLQVQSPPKRVYPKYPKEEVVFKIVLRSKSTKIVQFRERLSKSEQEIRLHFYSLSEHIL